MRIAFITPEFSAGFRDGGGLGAYVNKMSRLLLGHGHEPEVFVSSDVESGAFVHDGFRVERVPPARKSLPVRNLNRLLDFVGDGVGGRVVLEWYSRSRALAYAMERQHRKLPFDVIQSADFLAAGLAVRRSADRVHIVRCSTAADLYNRIDGRWQRTERVREWLERKAMRRADKVYAPSQFIADYFQKKHGIPVGVVRPPVGLETLPSANAPCGLPDRFLVHFGQLCHRKGTLWLGKALARAFEVEPSLRMVWVGVDRFRELKSALEGLGTHRWKVSVLYPLPRPELYALVQRAEAAVLPSLVDNLPNTVIECLVLGIPVIGTRGASVDELVEPGLSGELVAPDDVEALADAIVRVWRGESPVRKGFTWQGGIASEMQPERAVENLLRFARER